MIRQLENKNKKQKHNYARDFVLIIVALVVVGFYFQSERLLFLSPSKTNSNSLKSNKKIIYAGPITPQDLKLTSKDLAAVERFAKKNTKHFKQIQIYIERQDSYGGIKPSTQLRFYTRTRFNDNVEIKSVYTPCTLKQLPARIVRRLKDDTSSYLAIKKNNKGLDIKGFTNTM